MGTQVSIAGARPNQISYQLDGTDANTQGNGSPGSAAGGLLGVDTVREFQVLVNNYSAEYRPQHRRHRHGRHAIGHQRPSRGSAVRVQPQQPVRLARPTSTIRTGRFHRSSATSSAAMLGGPIVRDRTFFFGSYEGLRQDRGLTTIATVPSTRDARAHRHQRRRPRRTCCCTRSRTARRPAPPGITSVQIVDADARKLRARQGRSHALGRAPVDLGALLVGQGAGRSGQADPVLDRGHAHEVAVARSASTSGSSRASLLNVAKVAWNQAFEATDNLENRSFDPALFFIPDTRFGTITSRASIRSGPTRSTPTFVDLKSLQFIDNLTWSRGSHNVKAGFSVTHYMNDQDSSFDFGGLYAFTSLENFVQNRAGHLRGAGARLDDGAPVAAEPDRRSTRRTTGRRGAISR